VTEFLPAPISNTLPAVRLLTNVSGGPAFLNLFDAQEGMLGSTIVTKELNKSFKPNEAVFFHDFLVDDATSVFYNREKIYSYISQNILSDSYFAPNPPTITLYGTTNNTHSLSLTLSDSFNKTNTLNSRNHLSCSYVLDSYLSSIKVIVYRDIDGISYSIDGGLSCIKITNDGLLYPNEITSYAIQAHTSIHTSDSKSKIFIGTLREGLKSFTIGESVVWQQEGSDQMILTGNTPLTPDSVNNLLMFKYSFSNVTSTYPDDPQLIKTPDGILYDYIGVDYAPCYVLAVNNYPLAAGNGILVFVNNGIVEKRNPGLSEDYVIIEPKYLYLFKYLHSSTKQYTVSGKGYLETSETLTNFIDWTCIADPTTRIPYVSSPVTSLSAFPIIYDQLKQIPFMPSTEYTSLTSGDLLAVTEQESISYACNLYSLTGHNHIQGIQERGLVFTSLPQLNLVNKIESTNYSGLSYATIGSNTYVFLTEKDSVWYCNLTDTIPAWSKLLAPTDLYLDSNLSFTLNNPRTSLTGLGGFGIFQSRKTKDLLIGIFTSDLGYVQCSIINTAGVLSLSVGSLQFKSDMHSNCLRDLLVISDKDIALSCGLELEPVTGYNLPSSYGPAVKYSLYMPEVTSNLPSTVSDSSITTSIYKNFTSTESPDPVFYNNSNIFNIPDTHNTDQFFDIDFIYSPSVKAKKQILGPPTYYSGYTISLINKLTTVYVTTSQKHQKTSLLVRATESLTLNDSPLTLESELEIPYLPEINYSAAVSVPGYSYVEIPVSSTSYGVHGTTGSSSSSLYIRFTATGGHGPSGSVISTITPHSTATGYFSVYGGIATNVIPVASSATGFHVQYVGSSTNTISLINTTDGTVWPTGVSYFNQFIQITSSASGIGFTPFSNNTILVTSSAVGITSISGTSDVFVTPNSTATGSFLVFGDSVSNISISSNSTGFVAPSGNSGNLIQLRTFSGGYFGFYGQGKYPNIVTITSNAIGTV
jgi:hypothetical protein